jgi:hypothetical protein
VFESIKIEWKHLNDILKKQEVPLQILIWQTLRRTPLVSSWKGIFWEIVVSCFQMCPLIWTSSLHHDPITLFEQRDRHGKRLPTAIYGSPPQSIIDGHSVSNTIGSQGSFGKYRGTQEIFQHTKDSSHHLQDYMNFAQEGSHHEQSTLPAFYCLGCINLLAFTKGGWC